MTHTHSESALHKLAAELMSAPAVVAGETATIREVAKLMLTEGVGAVPIVSASGEAIGIASDGDLLFRVRDDGRRAWWLGMLVEGAGADEAFAAHRDRPVREVMSAPLISIGPRATAPEIAETLLVHKVKRLPVIEDGQVIGVVTRANLIAVVESIPKVRLEDEPGAGLLSFLEFDDRRRVPARRLRPRAARSCRPDADGLPAGRGARTAEAIFRQRLSRPGQLFQGGDLRP